MQSSPPGSADKLIEIACKKCGKIIAESLIACPYCHALTKTDQLKALLTRSSALIAEGATIDAVAVLSEARALVPQASVQFRQISERIAKLQAGAIPPSTSVQPQPKENSPAPTSETPRKNWLSATFTGAGLIAKFFTGPAQLLLVGLTKLPTLLSMAAFGALFSSNWRVGAGAVLSIYVHEMGHVAAMRREGIVATAPMFVPGLGAFVRMRSYPPSAIADAKIGLAGPLWGFGATVVIAALALAFRTPWLVDLASFSASINLFNLIPVWQLDGARGVRGLSQSQRRWVFALVVAGALATSSMVSWAIALLLAVKTQREAAHPEGDRSVFIQWIVLLVGLHALLSVPKLLA